MCTKKWIESGTPKGNAVEAISLDSHYKFEKVDNMVGLLNVINKEKMDFFCMMMPLKKS
jgi:hypothetical protein